MELDSGESLVTLEIKDFNLLVELRVCGEVRVVFNGEVFKSPMDFPDELKALFHNGTYGDDERVFVDDNNWFELFIYDKGKDAWNWTGLSEVVDADWRSVGDIYDLMFNYAKDYMEEFWLDHAYEVLDEKFPDADAEAKDVFACEYWQNATNDEWNCKQFEKFLEEWED